MNIPSPYDSWATLVELARSGDKPAIDTLAEAACDTGFRYYRHRLSKEDAEDLTQEFVGRLFTSLDDFKGGQFPAWAYSLMKWMLLDFYRRHHRQVPPDPSPEGRPELAQTEAYPDVDLSPSEHAALEEAILQLSPTTIYIIKSQMAFLPTPLAAVAAELGVSKTLARVKFHRARSTLKKQLRQDPRMTAWFQRHHLP